jgi:hypothetical protein
MGYGSSCRSRGSSHLGATPYRRAEVQGGRRTSWRPDRHARRHWSDAINEIAAGFYVHYGFGRIAGSRRLLAKISDLSAAFDK